MTFRSGYEYETEYEYNFKFQNSDALRANVSACCGPAKKDTMGTTL